MTTPLIDCPAPVLPAGAQGVARVAVLDETAQIVVTFERPVTSPGQDYLLAPRAYALTGGQRLFPRVIAAARDTRPDAPPDPEGRRVLLQLDTIGDFSIYTLTVSGPDIDPFFAEHKLRFRLACDDPFDCRALAPLVPVAAEIPVAIDYLSKDYAGFRQALLDFVPTRLPAWTERSEADIGMMLLELLAATADSLSYLQDRVANEAFLDTATQRRSVAAHLTLIGYRLDEGNAARAYLRFEVNTAHTLAADPGLRATNRPLRDNEPILVFETEGAATLRPEHAEMPLFNRGNAGCCLPGTALAAELAGEFPDLQAGDYLLIEDISGQRDIVRLTERPQISDAAGQPITVVRWSKSTPLHHDYCIDDAVARGNVVPATHGETIFAEPLRALSEEEKAALLQEIAARKPGERPPRQRLPLARGPLVYIDGVSALALEVDGEPWRQLPTLLESDPDDTVFRVEIDDAGDATVVFGDGALGARLDETAEVTATYRVGGGAVGNVGADTLTLARPRENETIPWLVSVTNPLPARGGRDRESRDHARRFGPATFAKPLIAVTVEDYQDAARDFIAEDGEKPIQRAKAAFRWTGSWLTVTLAVDAREAQDLAADAKAALLRYLDTRRLAGYDLEIVEARDAPIALEIAICLRPGFRPGDVEQAIVAALTRFFDPDNFSFGDRLFVSAIFAVVMAVPGVASAEITNLSRLGAARPDRETAENLRQGYLAVGADEILRLDNDRNFPQNGTLRVRVKGVAA